jgi:hypothetical protein
MVFSPDRHACGKKITDKASAIETGLWLDLKFVAVHIARTITKLARQW